jgi:hypothetical protein
MLEHAGFPGDGGFVSWRFVTWRGSAEHGVG